MANVVYLVGLGRSGSTVVSEYLATATNGLCLGEVVNIFELGVIRNELCQCGVPFHECDFWRAVGKVAFGRWSVEAAHEAETLRTEVDRLSAVFGLRSTHGRGQRRAYVEQHARVWAAAAAVTHASTVIDSSKHPAVASLFCNYVTRQEVLLLHIVRDSRPVAWSWNKHVRRPESGARETYMDHFDYRTSARLWNRTNFVAEVVCMRYPRHSRLRYEDFCAHPALSANRLRAHLPGLAAPTTEVTVTGTAFVHAEHAIGGNPMRFSNERLVVAADEEWRRSMPGGARRSVTRSTLPLLARYGYVPGPR